MILHRLCTYYHCRKFRESEWGSESHCRKNPISIPMTKSSWSKIIECLIYTPRYPIWCVCRNLHLLLLSSRIDINQNIRYFPVELQQLNTNDPRLRTTQLPPNQFTLKFTMVDEDELARRAQLAAYEKERANRPRLRAQLKGERAAPGERPKLGLLKKKETKTNTPTSQQQTQ